LMPASLVVLSGLIGTFIAAKNYPRRKICASIV